jgi:hypothetical protein
VELELAAVAASPQHADRAQYLIALCEAAPAGHTLEFGVWHGWSLSVISKRRPFVYGFDNFSGGLPEEWHLGPGNVREAGYFAWHDDWRKAAWPANCELIDGLFAHMLPGWLEQHPGNVGFVHIDSDLYSSARDVLTLLNDRIVPGTVLAFDELTEWNPRLPYPNWREHEWRALNEWLQTKDRRVVPIGRTTEYQAAFQVTQ